MPAREPLRREVLALAVPAFFALVAEPLFLLTDTAIVGHLGTAALAGLGVASAILLTAANLFVFLAYGTTAIVSRQLGSGAIREAISSGIDGVWLAIGLGGLVAVPVGFGAPTLVGWFGVTGLVATLATSYLQLAAIGIPGMLVALAATGVLRGLQDTRSPLLASVGGFTLNAALNLWFVFGLGWGIAGSALGTVIAQSLMGASLVAVLLVRAGRLGARLRPHPGGVLRAASQGVPLLVRTLALRTILLLTTWVAAGLGEVPLAAHQVALTIWTFQVFTLDALAIAAQALTGKALGAGQTEQARRITQVLLRWGVWAGVGLGVVVIGLAGVLPRLFTTDPAVQQALSVALGVIGVTGWLSGLVFSADGVLIGAGDGRWLAQAMSLTLLGYLPMILGLHLMSAGLAEAGAPVAVGALWVGFTWFMVLRWLLLRYRLGQNTWLVTGVRS